MTWSTTLPTEPGTYPWRSRRNSDEWSDTAEVFDDGYGLLFVRWHENKQIVPLRDVRGYWGKPIQPPTNEPAEGGDHE